MLFARPHPKKVIAVFDISSSSVAGGHVLIEHNTATPHKQSLFLASSRIDAALSGEPDITRLVEHVARNLDEVITRLHKADVHHPEYIQVVLASPWYLSQTRTIVYTKTVPFVCTQNLVEGLIDKELAHAAGSDTGFGTDGVVVEKQLSSIKLNGYATDKPYGKKVTSLECSITITTVPSVVMDRFITPIKRTYGDRMVSITTAPFATYVVARDMIHPDDECMVIDVGEEITDVAFVKDGLFLYQHSFPIGTYALYRGLAGTDILEARTLFEGYRLQKLGGLGAQKATEALGRFQESWQRALQQVLDTGRYGFCLPEHCYISADPRFEAVLINVIAHDPFIQHACSRGAVIPYFINHQKLDAYVGSIDDTALDMSLAVAALFAKRLIY